MTNIIEAGDTVKVQGYRYNFEVDSVFSGSTYYAGYVAVSSSWKKGRDIRSMALEVDPSRVTLVRKGNALDDQINALFAQLDAR